MKTVVRIFLTLAVAFNLVFAQAAFAKPCDMECCKAVQAQAEASGGCGHCEPVQQLSSAKGRCCDMSSGDARTDATLNTGASASKDTSSSSGAAVAATVSFRAPSDRVRPDYTFRGYISPPIYTLTSSYLC